MLVQPEIRAAQNEDLEELRLLFREYALIVGSDICFQSFETELANLPGRYAKPLGELLVATMGKELVGCVALRRFSESRCEMKRLYVRPQHRSTGLGRRLIERTITIAAGLGYQALLLDTLPSMTRAIGLYRELGFREVPRYGDNPPSALCFERVLTISI